MFEICLLACVFVVIFGAFHLVGGGGRCGLGFFLCLFISYLYDPVLYCFWCHILFPISILVTANAFFSSTNVFFPSVCVIFLCIK